MKKNKKWKVKFSEEATKKSMNLPEKAYEELIKITQGFKEGRLDPRKIGQPMKIIGLKIKLKCPECKSEDVGWVLDKNCNEVYFHCLKCGESFWMTYKEYKQSIKRNPDKIVSLQKVNKLSFL